MLYSGHIEVTCVMHHLGLDIVELARIKRAIDRWGSRFLNRVYTEAELELCRGRLPQLAVRFAAKEAVMKALGTSLAWREIEVLSDSRHKPLVALQGQACSLAERLGIRELAISLAHSQEYAVASVIGGSVEDRHC